MTGKILHDPHDPLVRHCSSILNYVILTKINLSKATKRRILSANRTRERLERKKQATEIELNNVNFDTEITEQVTDLAGVRLRHWITHRSWNICSICGTILRVSLNEAFYRNRVNRSPPCPCRVGLYIVPKFTDWPSPLHELTKTDQSVLSNYTLRVGGTAPLQHGYRQKQGPAYAILIPISS